MPKILCIDDDQSALEVLSALLTGEGYECLAAETPIQARARLITNHPDLIIIDHGLPGEDGISLAKVLKGISNVPVLMLTGRSEIASSLHVDKLLIKPQEPKAILAAIAELLTAPRARGSHSS